MFAALSIFAAIPIAGGSAAADLVPYQVVDGAIPTPLTDRPGNPAAGRAIAAGRRANCLACHHIPIPEQQFHGDLGPDLADVGSRLTAGELRLRLVDPKRINGTSIMPAYYRVEGLTRVARRYRGRPILDAQQIEDLVAYLLTLRAEAD